MAPPGEGEKLSFARDIRPLFREKDRDSMLAAFDLFDYGDVAEHADAIVGSLRSGRMPCDGAWPAAQVENSSSGLTSASPPSFAAWIHPELYEHLHGPSGDGPPSPAAKNVRFW